jgi:hypothetical protein
MVLKDQIKKECLVTLERKSRLKRGDTETSAKGDLTAIVWKDKRNVNRLTNMHRPPAEGNFWDEYENAVKPAIVQDYNRHMWYVDRSDCKTNSYYISRHMWKWMNNCSFTFWTFQFWTVLFYSLLLVQNYLITFQTCLGHRPNTREGEGALTRDHHREDQPLPPVNQLDLTYDTVNTDSQKEDKFGAACVLWRTMKCRQNSNVQNAMWGCVLLLASGCTTQNHIF